LSFVKPSGGRAFLSVLAVCFVAAARFRRRRERTIINMIMIGDI